MSDNISKSSTFFASVARKNLTILGSVLLCTTTMIVGMNDEEKPNPWKNVLKPVKRNAPPLKNNQPPVKKDVPIVKKENPQNPFKNVLKPVKKDVPLVKKNQPLLKNNQPEVKNQPPLKKNAPPVNNVQQKQDVKEENPNNPFKNLLKPVKKDVPLVKKDVPPIKTRLNKPHVNLRPLKVGGQNPWGNQPYDPLHSGLQEVKLQYGQDYDPEGNLTKKGLLNVLQLTKNIPSDIELKNISIKETWGGAFSGKIYIIDIKTQNFSKSFILKDLKWAFDKVSDRRENTPLKEKIDSAIINQKILPLFKKNVEIQKIKNPPVLTHTLTEGWYFDQHHKKKHFVIMEKASGISLGDWTDSFVSWKYNQQKNDLTIDEKKWLEIMKKVGRGLGELHQILRLDTNDIDNRHTIIHGDFHMANVFYDGESDKVFLIDIASMADSFKHKEKKNPDLVEKEFFYFFMMTKYQYGYLKYKDSIQWINKGLESFIDGYVSAYSLRNQQKFKKILMQMFRDWSQDFFNALLSLYYNQPPETNVSSKYGDSIAYWANSLYQDLWGQTIPEEIKNNLNKDTF